MQLWKLGCRWGGGTPLFYDFIKENNIVIGWVDKDYQMGDWLLITNGHTVLSLAKVISKRKTILDYPQWETEVKSLSIPFEKDLFIYDAKFLNLKVADQFTYPLQQGIVKVQGDEYIQTFKKVRTKYMAQENLNQHLNLLRYKKQIILQGPPGTGKTKLAKELAYELVGKNIEDRELDSQKIISAIKVEQSIPTVAGNSRYIVRRHENNTVVLDVPDGMDKTISHEKIKDFYKDNKWQKPTDNGDNRGAAAIAKFLHGLYYKPISQLETDEQIKLIQFHPSFSYEDFVRGIVAKPNIDGDGILYEAEDKLLADFAKLANENYLISGGVNEKSTRIIQAKTTLQKFIDYVQDELDKTPERKYQISDAVYLFDVDDKRFKYKGDNWKAHEKGLNMKFSELEKIIETGVTQRSDIKNQSNLESLTKQHATYFFNTLEKYKEFKKTDSAKLAPLDIKNVIKEKNYVLIIDEINRANLSSVLGELIYALEYRGEAIKSMYSVDGNNELILPPNLYIIGTMNTADRSVGHIDYAIRRRFAFVDVLPKDLSFEMGDKFQKPLFEQVANLFITNLSPEFDPKDVQLGHSYFIDKTDEGGSMQVRLLYEIKPILMEYVKDGILTGDGILQKIMDLSV